MPRMPGAVWRPLAPNWASQPRMSNPTVVCIHTMVGSLGGTDGYFRDGNGTGFAGTESHFGTGPDGEIRQWQDTAYQADANKDGNGHIISIENADFGAGYPSWNTNDGGAIPAFTDDQCEAIAKILAWCHDTHGIPLELIPDSKPGRRGVGFHRQGVDPYRVAGGEQWSLAYGKSCPGPRRIAQIPQIIARARQVAAGAPPTPEDDMFSDADRKLLQTIEEKLTDKVINGTTLPDAVRELHSTFYVREHDRAGLPDDAPYPKGRAIQLLRWADGNVQVLREMVAAQGGALEALADLLAAQEGIDPAELKTTIREAIAESVVRVSVDVSGGDNYDPEAPVAG